MKKKGVITLLVIAIIACLMAVIYTGTQREEADQERIDAALDESTYLSKKRECSGKASTTNKYVNAAGLTDCGGDMAVKAHLKIASVQDINYKYCSSSFGRRVYGCAYPATNKVYVCSPGSTLYNKRYAYSTRYYIYYNTEYLKCTKGITKNTIRHELLHLVYADLSESERASVSKKLAKYKSKYKKELSAYASSARDDELFVRVGADGRDVDDIELVELYSKVSAKYTAQKQEYYGSLATTADKYYKKYDDLYNRYNALFVVFIIIIIINAIILIVALSSMGKNNSNSARQKKPKQKSIFDDDFSSDDMDLEQLRRQIDEMGQKNKENKRDTQKEFEEFKAKYGVIDVDEDEDF